MSISHWLYKNKPFTEVPEDAFGFIYRITNKFSRKKYIGRKYFYSTRRVKQKGKKRRKVVVKESKWRSYSGSSKFLNEALDTKSKSNFKFEILAIGYTKGQVNYLEENIQMKLDVLTNPYYYNDSIGSRNFISIKIDQKFKKAIKDIIL